MGKRFGLTWSLISGSTVKGSNSFLDKGHVFYFDQFYSSTELFYQLANRKTYSVGEKNIVLRNVIKKHQNDVKAESNFP